MGPNTSAVVTEHASKARRFCLAVAVAGTLAGGCADEAATTTSQSTTAVSPSTSEPTVGSSGPSSVEATDAATVEAAVDIGGQEALGLAVDAEGVWAISFQEGTLTRIDPATNIAAATIEVGSGAASVVSDGDSLWVVGYGQSPSGSVYQVDPVAEAVSATIRAGELCCDPSSGGGFVWAVDPAGSAVQIDPATNTVVDTFPVTVDPMAHTNAVFAGGSLWVSSDTTDLARLDPESGAIEEFDVGGGIPFLARDGLVWGASPTVVWAIDDQSGDFVERIELTDSIEVLSMELAGDALWVGIRHPGQIGAVQQIDRATGAVIATFDDVDIPARMAIGFGSLWITDSGSNLVYRIGPIPSV